MNKNFITVGTMFAFVFAVMIFAYQFSLLSMWQEKVLDQFYLKKPASNAMVIFAIDNESINFVGQWPWSRRVFTDAIQKLQKAKVIALDVNFSEPSASDPMGDTTLANAIDASVPPVILPVQFNSSTKEVVEPLQIIKSKGALIGLVNVPNEDGVVRTSNNIAYGFYGFGATAAQHYQLQEQIPATMRIDYAGPQGTVATLPIGDLLQNKVPKSVYAGKIAFIGATAPDLHDFFQTPFNLLPGVEINANVAGTILAQKFYHNVPVQVAWLLILLCDLMAAALVLRIKRIWLLVTALIAVLVTINIIGVLAFSWYVVLPVLYMNLAFIFAAILFIIFQYIFESKERKFIHESFKYYLSEEVIDDILRNPQKLTLGGERKKITVFFSDVRGFSRISEVLSPEQLTYVLSEYMTEMTNIIMQQRGLVAQYFGDGIMAFWGAPLENENQAKDACLATLAMLPALEKLNARLKQEQIGVEIKIGVGINTAEVIAGNIGSKKKFNYTVFGDGVNLTSRLEGLNKEYGSTIIISQATKNEFENDPRFFVRELDTIVVKGKKEPTTIFELLTKPLDAAVATHFAQGRTHYQQGNWQEAITEFSVAGGDGPSEYYLKRCQEFLKNPPENWNGVYEFKTK